MLGQVELVLAGLLPRLSRRRKNADFCVVARDFSVTSQHELRNLKCTSTSRKNQNEGDDGRCLPLTQEADPQAASLADLS
jgi:hypothetical protein